MVPGDVTKQDIWPSLAIWYKTEESDEIGVDEQASHIPRRYTTSCDLLCRHKVRCFAFCSDIVKVLKYWYLDRRTLHSSLS